MSEINDRKDISTTPAVDGFVSDHDDSQGLHGYDFLCPS
jgi:hypothetical protein